MRKNKPELPPALVSTRGREALSSKFAFTDTHSLVSYVPKKGRNVILMSTLHKDDAVSTMEDRKPHIIQDYNSNKGGVDCLDKVMHIFIYHAFYFTFIHVKHCIQIQYYFKSLIYCFFHCSLLEHTPASE